MDWKDLPHHPARPAQQVVDQQLLTWYEFFFAMGTPTMVKRALRLIEGRSVRHARVLPESPGQSHEQRKRPAYRRQQIPLPLGRLIAAFVERDLCLDDALGQQLVAGVGGSDRGDPAPD